MNIIDYETDFSGDVYWNHLAEEIEDMAQILHHDLKTTNPRRLKPKTLINSLRFRKKTGISD